jgi:HNH endonuclease
MTENQRISQTEFVKRWFEKNPNRDIPHSESKEAIESAWEALTNERMEDSDRAIRRLSQDGILIRVKKGVYRYDPTMVTERHLEDFSAADKKIILERDGNKCVICGLGPREGLDLQVDHIKAKELGGKAEISNGQTLCARHNFIKKISSQTETGKKMFIHLLEVSSRSDDPNREQLIAFCEDILEVFEKHGINGHIEWKAPKKKEKEQ